MQHRAELLLMTGVAVEKLFFGRKTRQRATRNQELTGYREAQKG
jgi:hypothetical protein